MNMFLARRLFHKNRSSQNTSHTLYFYNVSYMYTWYCILPKFNTMYIAIVKTKNMFIDLMFIIKGKQIQVSTLKTFLFCE